MRQKLSSILEDLKHNLLTIFKQFTGKSKKV